MTLFITVIYYGGVKEMPFILLLFPTYVKQSF